jgi:hypothetical protein
MMNGFVKKASDKADMPTESVTGLAPASIRYEPLPDSAWSFAGRVRLTPSSLLTFRDPSDAGPKLASVTKQNVADGP